MDLLIPLALILVGLALIGAEIWLVPGFNVVGILGFLVLMFAIGFMFSTGGMVAGWISLAGTLVMGVALGWVVWKSGAWERFVLATTIDSNEEEEARLEENRARYLGHTGRAVTPLRPTGVAEISNERLEVTTEGGFIASGSEVRVVAMDRRRLFVRLAESPASPPSESTAGLDTPS